MRNGYAFSSKEYKDQGVPVIRIGDIRDGVVSESGANKSLADLDNLPEPDTLAEEIIENLESGLESFREIVGELHKSKKS